MESTRIKICGITRLEDAQLAAELGAWAVGLILVPGSPRRVRTAEAERIAGVMRATRTSQRHAVGGSERGSTRTEVAGVFANAHLDDVARLHTRIGFTVLQLHGDEGPAYATEAHRRLGIPVIKARAVRTRGDLQALDAFRDVAFHMVDAPKDGAGEALDLELLAARRSSVPLILAGGLTPENVAAATAAAQPFAVDTARGTEAEPGVKDPEKMRAFFAALETPAVAP